MTVAVVTDSTADLSPAVIERFDITVVPLTIEFNGESYQDRVDLDPVDFLAMLPDFTRLPKTATPSPGAFVAVYQEALKAGAEGIISIHLAGGLSATVRSAEAAARMVDGPVYVIDGGSASLGTGLLVWWGALRAEAGADIHTVVAEIAALKAGLFALIAPVTLEYLARGGRIGQAARLIGTILDMKPILMLENGVVKPERKVRGERQIVPAMLASMAMRVEPGHPVLAAIGHSGNLAQHQSLMAAVQNGWRVLGWLDGVIGPVISSHVGPGAYGLIVVPLDETMVKRFEEVRV